MSWNSLFLWQKTPMLHPILGIHSQALNVNLGMKEILICLMQSMFTLKTSHLGSLDEFLLMTSIASCLSQKWFHLVVHLLAIWGDLIHLRKNWVVYESWESKVHLGEYPLKKQMGESHALYMYIWSGNNDNTTSRSPYIVHSRTSLIL